MTHKKSKKGNDVSLDEMKISELRKMTPTMPTEALATYGALRTATDPGT